MPRGVRVDVRVYLPGTLDELAAMLATGELPQPAVAHAVTAALRADDPDADIDEWEFQAFGDAAASSVDLLRRAGAARRVVVSADVAGDRVLECATGEDGGADGTDRPLSLVQIDGAIEASAVAAVHVDGEEAEPVVRAVLAGAEPDVLDDVALEWYSPGEVAELLA